MRTATLAILLLVTTSTASPTTISCPQIPVCDLVSEAEAIVVGEIESLGEPVDQHSASATFRVTERYKGHPLVGDTFEKVVPRGSEVGRQWLVSFLEDDETGALKPVGSCTDEPVDEAGTKLSFLDAWAAGSLRGFTQIDVEVNADDLVVVAEGAQGRYETRSDSSRAVFNGIPLGVYSLTASGDGFESMPPEEAELVDLFERRCNFAMLHLEPTNVIAGVVLGPEGQPVSGAPVTLIRSGGDGSPEGGFHPWRTTDAGGRFEFEKRDPGRYWLGVNAGSVSQAAPYPSTFYPGVENIADAAPLEITADDQRTDLKIQVSRRLQERSVRVRVLWSDGSPAAGAHIVRAGSWDFADADEFFRYTHAFESQPANEEGWAEVTLYQPSRYRLRASYFKPGHMSRTEDDLPGESELFEIEPGPGPRDLEVRLRRYEPGIGGSKHFLE